jgi:hypothetical protein
VTIAKTNLTLTRYFIDGTAAPAIDGITISKCKMYIGMSLYYNNAEMDKARAHEFARTVADQPLGTVMTHPSGHAYKITRTLGTKTKK